MGFLDATGITTLVTKLKEYFALNSALESVESELDGKQDTLVSGTNIKTINNESLLGSGNITIQGGGGGSTITPVSVTLPNTDWSTSLEHPHCKSVNVQQATTGGTVIVSPNPGALDAWTKFGVYCYGMGNGVMYFAADSVPDRTIVVDVLFVS